MQIRCQCLADMILLHHTETQTIDERIALSRMPAEKLLRLIERLGVGIDRPQHPAGRKLIQKIADQMRCAAGHQKCTGFTDYPLSGDRDKLTLIFD